MKRANSLEVETLIKVLKRGRLFFILDIVSKVEAAPQPLATRQHLEGDIQLQREKVSESGGPLPHTGGRAGRPRPGTAPFRANIVPQMLVPKNTNSCGRALFTLGQLCEGHSSK